MFQKVIVLGRLGGDPEMRYTAEGQAITHASVAVDEGQGENKKAVWFRCSFWGKTAEAVNQYCSKGDVVLVEGRLKEPSIWKGNDGTMRTGLELSATGCKFVQTKKRQAEGGAPAEPARTEQPDATATPIPAPDALGEMELLF